MKKHSIRTCAAAFALVLALNTPQQAHASGENGPLAVVVDAAVVRPATFVVTVLGAGLFVATLPFSLPSKSVKKAGDALVVKPARMTFTRPLGDLDSLAREDESPAENTTASEGKQ